MSDLLLSIEERHRFIDYCRREADSLHGVAEQMKKMLGVEMLIKDYTVRCMAYKIVADDMEKIEDLTL